MAEAVAGQTERVYVGRFSIAIPAGMRREGGAYEMRLLNLSEVALAPPHDAAWRAAWAAKLAEVEALKSKRSRPRHIYGEVAATGELEPRFAFIAYHRDNVKEAAQLEALRGAEGVGLWLERPVDLEDLSAIHATVLAVGRAYQPRPPAGPPSARPEAFHLPLGAVLLPYQEQESAQARFKSGPPWMEIDLSTESMVEVDSKGLFERFGEAVVSAGAAFTAGISTVRSGKRRVGDLAGEEFVMRDTEKGKLYFMWTFPGEAGSGTRPRIQLQLITGTEGEKEKLALWDALLASLRPAAQGAAHDLEPPAPARPGPGAGQR